MFKNYIIIAIRNLRRNTVFSVINISGLAIGMASAMIILLWIRHERNYDAFHEKKDRIYEVWNRAPLNNDIWAWNNTPRILARTLEKDFPEIEQALRVKRESVKLLTAGEKKLNVSGSVADSNFFHVFTFPLLYGNIQTAMKDHSSIVITEGLARKLFADVNVIGKTIRVEDKDDFIVSGVVKSLPDNSRFKFEFLLPYNYAVTHGEDDTNWGNNSITTYVLLKPKVNVSLLNEKLKTLKPRYYAPDPKWEMFVYPISRWRLYSNFKNGVEENNGRILYVQMFGIIAAFILIIACINFMNLSTARSEKRAKEVGIRKVVGAQKTSIIGQFIGESIFLSFFSAVIATIIVVLTLPLFNQLMEEKIELDLSDPATIVAGLGFVLFTGIIAGSYPAFYLSSFQPVKVLKGTFNQPRALISPRKILVITQFSFAIFLIICTIIIKQQIDFLRNREIGYNKNQLIYHTLNGDLIKNYELLKQELLSTGVATSLTKTMSPPTQVWSNGWGQDWEGKDPNDRTSFNRYSEDGKLGKTAGLQFVQGRDLDPFKFPTDSTGTVVNEAAIKLMKFADPIGKRVSDNGVDWHIVGVFKDFIINSPYETVEPMIVFGPQAAWSFNTVLIRLNDKNSMQDNVAKASAIFRKYNPNFPFDYQFVDEQYEMKLESEKTVGVITGIFASLTIFIACLGLFGLAAYMTESRVKEIGVRKVLGDSVGGITMLLSSDFLKLVFISFLIAAPLGWWGMVSWLQEYEYRVRINWSVFALTGLIAIIVTMLTVGGQTIKAAMTSPAKSLRSN